jgi:hypothetical protein
LCGGKPKISATKVMEGIMREKSKLDKAKAKFISNLADFLFDTGLAKAKRDLNNLIRLAREEGRKGK